MQPVSNSEFSTYRMLSNTERCMRSLKAFEYLVECAAFASGSHQLAALRLYIGSGRSLFTVVRLPRAVKDFFDPSIKEKDLDKNNSLRDYGIHFFNHVSPFNNALLGCLVPLSVESGLMERSEGLNLFGNLAAASDCLLSSRYHKDKEDYKSNTDLIGGVKYLLESTVNVAQMLGLDPRVALALKSCRLLGLWQSVRQTKEEIKNAKPK